MVEMLNIINLHQIQIFMANLSPRRGFLLSFALGFVIRLIPELLSFPYPIGFDMIYYAAMIKRGVIWQGWMSVFSMWLFNAVVIPIHQITRLDPFILLKLVMPLLYAFNVCGVYNFARKALGWTVNKSLLVSLFFAFQLASLRLSWDLYRNMLGLAILLFSLPLIRRFKTKRDIVLFALLSMLIVFAHLLVTIVLLAVIFGVVVCDLTRGERMRVIRVLSAVFPALVVFVSSVFLVPLRLDLPANAINAYEEPSRPGGLFFLVNYLGVSGPVHNYSGYFDLILKVFSLFGVLYLWWLPIVFVGFFRDRILDGWALVLLAGSFNALLTPFCALDFWHRWMFMLVYPFTFYAVNGVVKVFSLEHKKNDALSFGWLRWLKVSRRGVLLMCILNAVLGLVFMVVPPFFDKFGVFSVPTTVSYFPSTMLYGAVPLRDVESTVRALMWLNDNMDDDSSVLVHFAFLRWADFYLDEEHVMVYFVNDIEGALGVALGRGFNSVYFVWWNEDYFTWGDRRVGWYGFVVPEGFVPVFSVGRISVFEYFGSIKLIGE
jgi:hypothetical protein